MDRSFSWSVAHAPLRIVVVAALTVAFATTLPVPTADALVAETPLSTDHPDHPVGPDGRVNDVVIVGNVAYIGGDFDSVGGEPRANLAAISLTTGEVTNWVADTNGEVEAVAASPDGETIYAGGWFQTVNGETRRRLVALDAGTGAVTNWNPNPSAYVRAIDATASTVYVGGNFQSIGGRQYRFLAAVNASTGNAVQGWNPNPNQPVRAIDLAPDGDTLFVAGNFTQIDGAARSYSAALDPADGDVTNWTSSIPHEVLDLEVGPGSDIVYFAVGGPYAQGGNLAVAYSTSGGGNELWSHQADGDFQAVTVASDAVYFGGHFYRSESRIFDKLISYHPVTGARNNNWAPGANSAFGVWALDYENGRLAVGGDFSIIGDQNQPHFAVFLDDGNGGNLDPTADFTWSCDGLTCSFDADPSGDLDGAIVAYTWTFGDGNGGNGVATTHDYAEPGTYTVRLTVRDNDGATDSTTQQVTTTNQAPSAALTVECTYLSCTLDGTASSDPDGTIVDWEWLVDGEPVATGATAGLDFDSPGEYTVLLAVTDDGGEMDSSSAPVTVVAAPVHIHDLTPQPIDLDDVKWRAVVSVAVRDAAGNPVAGAVVEGYFGQGKVRTCTTGANGKCKVKVKVKDTKNRIPWTVTSATSTGAYAPEANHDAIAGDSDGTTILVWQP